ncbi:Rieske (2Fe-2S) protein [Paenibacillus pinihumi]|uniref:Rieske (2Fe-2S) protein n=1 Tax=Paenibacillus pinihumi TaxID=669462 RepID=UPI00048C5C4E|nr:Rieske (2Fe-2S) protein [Paenibacillus pinihumi]
MSSHFICKTSQLVHGMRRLVSIEGISIGVFNVNGEFKAVKNLCPHQGAPLCRGNIGGMTVYENGSFSLEEDGKILRCPWHGWEFNLATGRSVFAPNKCRVKTYPVTVQKEEEIEPVITFDVTVESGNIYVHL